jgi:hypothetical protein
MAYCTYIFQGHTINIYGHRRAAGDVQHLWDNGERKPNKAARIDIFS